ncbi:short chain dehydrogenase domain-containing protein [Rhizoctonia solani AG-1 IA]|uniref:Short chain dehydrogenase domain-containing protein n=1 Tax=Thanatephorus cucumeris (strain AG1-IA) TaxID=983506 RepID=L8WTD5_THACA|nr:short chain dehydrogenase domain-containing protein [Rhizoctonia solani AG-1 IA]
MQELADLSEDDFDRVMSVNCKGTLYSYRAAARQMLKQGPERGGRIIGASSICGLKSRCLAERTPYCTSKFAIRAITQTAALEWGQYGITVNAYAPGPIDTPSSEAYGTTRRSCGSRQLYCISWGILYYRTNIINQWGAHYVVIENSLSSKLPYVPMGL